MFRSILFTPAIRRFFILLWVLLCCAPVFQAPLVLAAPSLLPAAQIPSCEKLILDLHDDANWPALLVNPRLDTPEQVEAHLQKMNQVHTCLQDETAALSSSEERLLQLSEYFIIFAGGYQTPADASTLYLIDLAETDDSAIIKLRQEVGIPAPPGLVYVRFYDSRQHMPVLVQRAFANDNVAGVTILNRYIAILAEDKLRAEEKIVQAKTLPETHSHELVHAYINSALGEANYDQLPDWYHEGLATYFSGSTSEFTVEIPGGMAITHTSPQEYQQYNLNFEYLEAQYGKERLYDLIRQSVQQADAGVLLGDLGLQNEEQLVASSQAWEAAQLRRRGLLVMGLAILSVAMLVNLPFVLNLLAPVQCECGYQGGRREFKEGRCPNCGERVHLPATPWQRLAQRRAAARKNQPASSQTPAPLEDRAIVFNPASPGQPVACQVCGRRFVGEAAQQVVHWPYQVRVWADSPASPAYPTGEPAAPRLVFVRRACQDCLQRSAALRKGQP